MKAPARLHGAAPPVPSQPPIVAQRWRRLLLPALGIAVAVLAMLLAMAWLDHAEGDLRQVRAPAVESSTATASLPPSALDPSATRVS